MDKNLKEKVRSDVKCFELELQTKYKSNVTIYVAFKKSDIENTISLEDIFQALVATLETNDPELLQYFVTDKKTRIQDYCNYMHAFCYQARNFGFTYKKIGDYINKNHATVIHSKNKAQELLDTNDAEFLHKYNLLTKNIEAHVGSIPNNVEV